MAKGSTLYGQPRVFSDQAPAVGGGGSIPTIQFSASRGALLENFSKQLFGMGQRLEDQLDQQAEAEAAKEGAIAGMTGNTEEQTYETIRGRAYNKAMLETFVTTMDTNAMIGAARLEQQHWNNPAALEAGMNDFFGGMAEEIDRIAPGSGAAFRARQTARALPAVERARDTKFKLTRDEADARLLEYEGAVTGSIKKGAQGLFSDNPTLSSASSTAVAQATGEYLRTYDATDPVTGRPLYSESEKAKARIYIRDKVYSEASLAWFDQQEDKVGAYLKMQDPDFKFNFNVAAEKPANVVYENKGATRSQPVQPAVMQQLAIAGGALGEGVQVHITSGGQPSKKESALARARGLSVGGRTGSDRHDHGNAADVVLSLNGKKVTPQEAPQLYQQFIENAVAAGATGVGHYAWGVHIGGGSEAAWGADTTGATLDPAYEAAFSRGKARRKAGGLKLGEAQNMNMALREQMSEAAYSRLDAEMRQRINFENTQADRLIKAEKEELEASQAMAETSVQMRIYAEGELDADGNVIKPIDVREIDALRLDGVISDKMATAFTKAVQTEKPDRSDPIIYDDLYRRMITGEDIQDDVLRLVGSLSKEDERYLISQNGANNRSGSFTPEESRGLSYLEGRLTPDTNMAALDPERQQRAFDAKTEYEQRVKSRRETGERIDDIVQDIASRYTVRLFEISTDQLNKLGQPMFFVPDDAKGGRRINVAATGKKINEAFKANKITEDMAIRQMELLDSWRTLQEQLDKEEAAISSKGKKK